MSIDFDFDTGFYSGGSVAADVPDRFDVAINGRPYMLFTYPDTPYERRPAYTRRPIQLLAPQQDNSGAFGENSLSNQELVRRSQDSWDHGAGQCLSPETRVLTADLQWVPVGDLVVGQRLVAFEEEATTRRARQWRESVVTGTGRITKPCYRMLMSDGTKFVASFDHKWLKVVKETQTWGETQNIWPRTKSALKSTKLVKIMEPWDFDASRGAGYLAAAFDGEGCLTQTPRPPRKDRLMLSFAQRQNGMLDRVRAELTKRGFRFSDNARHLDGYDDVTHLNLLGGTNEILRFLGSMRPERLLPKFQPLNNGVVYGTPVEVLECEYVGEQEVVALSTSTETFIAEGYASHNTFFDRPDSDNRRFRSSKGIDVWERWAMQLLPDTGQKLASPNTNLALAVAGSRVYAVDGTALRYTTDLTGAPTWTAVTGLPSAATSIATDGYRVWTAHGTGGVYGTTRIAGASAQTNLLQATIVGYVRGRLMAAITNDLYNITDYTSTTAPSLLWAHPNSDWRWIGFASGTAVIYAGGYSGDKSEVYRISVNASGTALDQPIMAGELPDGEVLTAIETYVGGIVVLGTSKGVRFCVENSDGSLTIGGPISTTSPVLCFEGQGRFIWYGLSNYDSLSTGLGRLDPSVFTDTLTPAYASDLMVTGQGAVLSAVTFQDKRVLAVSGLGIYTESANKVASGTLDTGLVTYGIPDVKVAMFLDVKVRTAVDTNRAYVSTDGGEFVLIGSRSTSVTDPFPVGEKRGETFEVRHELLNADIDPTAGPVVTRWTLRAYPNPHQGEVIGMVLDLTESQLTALDSMSYRDPAVEYEFLRALGNSRQQVTLQLGSDALTVIVDDHQWSATTRTEDGRSWNGICELSLKAMAT